VTVLLARRDIERLLDCSAALRSLTSAFIAARSGGILPQRVRTLLPHDGTATALLPGLIEGIPAYTVKVNAKFPKASPALRGVVALHDLDDGRLLALLDSASITAWRTGLAAAVATHALAPASASTVGVIGAGAQSRMMVRGLAHLRAIESLTIYDLDPCRSRAFADDQKLVVNAPVVVAECLRQVTQQSDILLLATWSTSPLLHRADLREGMHITSLGADEPGKAELAVDVLRDSWLVVDDRALALATGAVGNVGLGEEVIDATLGQILAGECPARQGGEQVSVYTPVGLPWQDLALSWPVYQAAGRAATTFDFLA
jgi:alanine dehydrogenase